MKINIKDVISVLSVNEKTNSQLETIILDYGNLAQKMNNIEQQTWLFKKAKDNNHLKLNDLKNKFEEIRAAINSNTIDDLIEVLNEENEKILKLNKMEMNSIIFMGLSALSTRKSYIEELMEIKSRVDEMKELNYYLKKENNKSLVKLVGW